MIWIYFLIFTVLFVVALFGFWVRWQWDFNYKTGKNTYNLAQISVVVPFRDEAENLPKLIASLNKLEVFPREIIFVNDHSSDDFQAEFSKLSVPFSWKIIHLAAGDEGKKTALRAGISVATGETMLTWDADIEVKRNYFKQLALTAKSDLLILPVSMEGKFGIQSFYELDYAYLNALNVAVSGHRAPIVASGANLLFDKAIFEEIDSFEEHEMFASGDDVFLLQDFKQHKKSIELTLQRNLQVKTHAPTSAEEFFNQRLRWIGKSSAIPDRFAQTMALLGGIYHLGFWLFFITDLSWGMLKILVVFKLIIDFSLLFPYLKALRRLHVALFVPLFSLVYPIYMLMIAVASLFYQPIWKGKAI